jgi:hypothetical protein
MSWSECSHFYINDKIEDVTIVNRNLIVSKNKKNDYEVNNQSIEEIIEKINNNYKIQDIFYNIN